jgi:hypothetical protein
LVNVGLESGRGVNKSYRYNEELVMAVPSTKSSLLLIALADTDPVVRILKVELSIDLGGG